MASSCYRFRGFCLDPAARELWCGGERIALPGSAFDCLVYLIEQRDRAVGRDELIAAIWGRADVADSLLAQTVLKVRRVLGDSGSDGAIRTVARFGYRWVEPTEVETAPEAAAEVAIPSAFDVSAAQVAASGPVPLPRFAEPEAQAASVAVVAPSPRPHVPGTRLGALAGAGLLAVLATVIVMWWSPSGPTPPTAADASTPAAGEATQAAVWVLPSSIDAPAGWEWLRLGLTDLIGNRLREGGVPTAPTETVLALLSSAEPGAESARLQVQPDVHRVGERWRVRLRLAQQSEPWEIESDAEDVLQAARAAADLLLIRLGRLPPDPTTDARPLALEELLQRTKAAILSDQLELARHLIERAPEAVRSQPEISLRLAQIDLARGDHGAAEVRLQGILDGAASLSNALRGRVLLALGSVQFQRDRLDEARGSFDEAILHLKDANDPIALAAVYGSRAAVASLREDYGAAEADLGRARIEMDVGGDALGLAQVDVSLALTQVRAGRPALGLSALRDAETRIRQLGAREELAYVRYAQVGAQLQLLDYAAAAKTVASFWPPEAHTANQRMRWRLRLAQVHLLLASGQLQDARHALDMIESQASPADDVEVRAAGRALSVLVAAAAAQAEDVVRMADSALNETLRQSQPDLFLLVWSERARSLGAVGEMQAAAADGDALAAWVESRPSAWRGVHAQLARAEQALAEGRRDQALALFGRAHEEARRLGIPDDQVSVAEPYSRLLIEMGRLEDAAAVVGSIAGWAAQDARAAWAQARLYRAQGRIDAWERSALQATALSGERRLDAAVHD